MTRTEAEKITEQYLKDLYGYSLKRCRSIQDAEDLTQEIVLKIFTVLTARDDITDIERFVWTVARNTLANYYRAKSRHGNGICIDTVSHTFSHSENIEDSFVQKETESRLHKEIARLSALQRRIIIAYYYENKKQSDIAAEFEIPQGTVKWHLFEAKKELRKGMEKMRSTGELKFNPIKFGWIGTNGSIGTMGSNGDFLRSALAQNIAYCVKESAKTINDIADELGTSPVYIESEVDFLTEYCFLIKQGDKYISNIIISEPDEAIFKTEHDMYYRAAKLFAPKLFDDLTKSGIMQHDDIICSGDDNFKMWALFPYAAALSGEATADRSISFEEAMTVRPDGGVNICDADVTDPYVKKPEGYLSIDGLNGPRWNTDGSYTLWQVDSPWSAARATTSLYPFESTRVISLIPRIIAGEKLTAEEYAFLNEKGYTTAARPETGAESVSIMCVKTDNAAKEIIAVGDKIKNGMRDQLNALKAPYVNEMLRSVPTHLRKARAFQLQYIFESDGKFLLYCLTELINTGKLKLPNEAQKKALTTLLVSCR